MSYVDRPAPPCSSRLPCHRAELARLRGSVGPGHAAKHARRIRFLCAVAVVVAIVLRCRRRARPASAMRRTALLVRGARAWAAVRKGVPGILPSAGPAARPKYRLLDAGSDAGAAPRV